MALEVRVGGTVTHWPCHATNHARRFFRKASQIDTQHLATL